VARFAQRSIRAIYPMGRAPLRRRGVSRPEPLARSASMQVLFNIAIIIACAAVVVVLFMGLWNMIRGGDGNTSQKLMRFRVIAQAIALILIMGALFFFGGNRG
jgi:hypothetical protein